MSFGDRLQALRRGNDMTQEEFAQQLKVSRQAVSKWESARGYPEIEKIIYICNHYGVTMDELFRDEVCVPTREEDGSRPRTEDAPLESPPLKAALGNFFANLSPLNRFVLGVGTGLAAVLLLILLAAGLTKGETHQMIMELVWLCLLILFGIGEAMTVGLTSIWFAAGSLVALVCALLGGPQWLQLALFIAISALCLLAMRPLARKYLNTRVQPTNADRILGAVAPVTEEIDNLRARGAVSVNGLTWSARSGDNSVIPAGALVRILRIEGVKVIVEEVKEEIVCH